MTKLQCPRCDKPAMSAWRKMSMGPAMPVKCAACGKRVGVPWSSMLTMTPFIAALLGAAFIEPLAGKVLVFITGFAVMSVIHVRWVPLVPR